MNKTKPINIPCRKITLEERENSTPVNVTDYKSIMALYYLFQQKQDQTSHLQLIKLQDTPKTQQKLI